MLVMYGFLICVLCIVSIQSTTPFESCPGGPQSTPSAIRVGSCVEKPCAIQHGKNFTIEVDFTAPDNLDDVESAAFVRVVAVKDIKETVKNKIRHYYLNFYQELSNCVDSKVGYFKNKACPIKKNDVVTYALDMNLEKPFDTFFQMHDDNEFSLHFDFFGMNNAHLMCADVPAVFEKKF